MDTAEGLTIGPIIEELKRCGIDYELEDDGQTVLTDRGSIFVNDGRYQIIRNRFFSRVRDVDSVMKILASELPK